MADTPVDIKPRTNFGWLPDIPDHRDFPYQARVLRLYGAVLPSAVDLSPVFPQVYDQGNLGSCVANVVAAAIEYEQRKRKATKSLRFVPSRLFLYYGAREYINMTEVDSGCYIRDALKVAYNVGAPRESGWTYNDYQNKFTKKPPTRQYLSAKYHKITEYRRVNNSVLEIKDALANGYAVTAGVAVFSSFFYDRYGNIPYPGNEYMEGGHAILLVGYDDATQRFKFRNSWGEEWGQNGYGTIPYEYVANPDLCDDLWVLTDTLYKERFEGG